LCKRCAAPPSSFEDVWGHDVRHPPYLLTKDATCMHSVPVAKVHVFNRQMLI
jgi:hypothetical protein